MEITNGKNELAGMEWEQDAFVLLAALKESVVWELAPSIMDEIRRLVEEFPRRHIASPAPEGFKLPDELMDGAVKVVRPTDLRNRVGMYMMEERGVKMGRNVDPGDVQDMIVEFVQRESAKEPK